MSLDPVGLLMALYLVPEVIYPLAVYPDRAACSQIERSRPPGAALVSNIADSRGTQSALKNRGGFKRIELQGGVEWIQLSLDVASLRRQERRAGQLPTDCGG
jgi:hypothetical protein